MKKYKLTSESKEVYGVRIYRIEALKDFSDVKKGDKGGWIEKEENLSQESEAWVCGDARVFGNAWVCGDARVCGDAEVCGELKLTGGHFYHTKKKTDKISKIELNKDYELLANNPIIEEKNSKKQELLDKAQELIDKANELKEKAGEF